MTPTAILDTMRPGRRATYEDIIALPEHVTGELVDGVLYTQARAARSHARVASRLGMLLGGPFDLADGGPGGSIVLDEPELHLGEDVLVPDLAGWRVEAPDRDEARRDRLQSRLRSR